MPINGPPHCWYDFGNHACLLDLGHIGDHMPTSDSDIIVSLAPVADSDIDTVARWAIRTAATVWMEDGWGGSLPDVGEHDYERITDRMLALLLPAPLTGEFDAAYKALAIAAEPEAQGDECL